MAICPPYYNSVLKRMEYLEQIARGERPEGRPLTFERDTAERDTARSLIQSGLSYEATLWMPKGVAEQHSMEPSPDYSFGTHHHFHIDLKHSQRIRSAVDREWQVKFDTTPPSPPKNWWKNDDRVPNIYFPEEVQSDP